MIGQPLFSFTNNPRAQKSPFKHLTLSGFKPACYLSFSLLYSNPYQTPSETAMIGVIIGITLGLKRV